MIDDTDIAERPLAGQSPPGQSPTGQSTPGPLLTTADIDQHTIGFGSRCNEYVDVIQQALDLALGNTGNLAPDRAVVDALEQLYATANGAGASALVQLLVPLNKVLSSAEQAGFTLSQADTLLVQEAIIAITLGIDSIVNRKSTPRLLADVTQRVIDVAAENKHEVRANSEAAGLVDVFVADADELLQRIFEQIQRWRASAHGGGRGYLEISRLLKSLHHNADEAGLSSIATLVSLLSERIKAQHEQPDDELFDLAIEVIEVLGDDLDRVRNNEQLIEHSDLNEKLAVASSVALGSSDRDFSGNSNFGEAADPEHKRVDQLDPGGVNTDVVIRRDNAPRDSAPRDKAPRDARFYRDQALAEQLPVDALSDTDAPEPGCCELSEISWLGKSARDNQADHRELTDLLREVSQGQDVIRERIEQMRRTIHLYPHSGSHAVNSQTAGVSQSPVSALDNLFFKIDSALSRQRKSVMTMASVLGMPQQQTVEALGTELKKLTSAPGLSVTYLNGVEDVVIDSQLFEHLGYALKYAFETVLLVTSTEQSKVTEASATSLDTSAKNATLEIAASTVTFEVVDGCLKLVISGSGLCISEFVLSNSNLRRVDEQMLKTQLPQLYADTDKVADPAGARANKGSGQNNDLVALAVFQRLIDTVVFFQGKIGCTSIDGPGPNNIIRDLEISLPITAANEEVVVVRKGQCLYAVQSAAIKRVENVTAFDGVYIYCERSDGGPEGCLHADSVVGRSIASVTKNTRLMLGDDYVGAFILNDSTPVLVINPESVDLFPPHSRISD